MEIVEKILALVRYLRTGLEMNYNSMLFFVCLVVFLGFYFLLRSSRAKRYGILLANIVFYIWAGVDAVFIVFGTALVVYGATRIMEKIYKTYDIQKEGMSPKEAVALLRQFQKKTKKILLLAMFLVIGIWVCVKIGKLTGKSTVVTMEGLLAGEGIIVPLGISYYTLSAVGYMLDVYWRKSKVEHNFIMLFTVMTYFPHIVQGPISKYNKLLEQFQNIPKMDYQRLSFGLQLMLWGYIKKMVIADRLSIYTNAVFQKPTGYAGMEVFLAVVLCVFQLYADFSGCMDIVCGISQALGIELEKNFRQPLYAHSGKEFWARWHITLGAWTKDYIYLPIAMNPKFMKWTRQLKKNGKGWISSFIKAFLPLIAVWIFTGLWHGTGYDYLVWGMYWCMILTLAKELDPVFTKVKDILKIDTEKWYYPIWQRVRTFFIFGMGRMFTVTGSLSGCILLWKQLFIQRRVWVLFDGSLYKHGLDQKDFYIAIFGIVLVMIVEYIHEKGISIRESIAAVPLPVRWGIYYVAMFVIVVFGVYGPGFDAAAFVYGAF